MSYSTVQASIVIWNPNLLVGVAALLHCITPPWKVPISLHKQAMQWFHMNISVHIFWMNSFVVSFTLICILQIIALWSTFTIQNDTLKQFMNEKWRVVFFYSFFLSCICQILKMQITLFQVCKNTHYKCLLYID